MLHKLGQKITPLIQILKPHVVFLSEIQHAVILDHALRMVCHIKEGMYMQTGQKVQNHIHHIETQRFFIRIRSDHTLWGKQIPHADIRQSQLFHHLGNLFLYR